MSALLASAAVKIGRPNFTIHPHVAGTRNPERRDAWSRRLCAGRHCSSLLVSRGSAAARERLSVMAVRNPLTQGPHRFERYPIVESILKG